MIDQDFAGRAAAATPSSPNTAPSRSAAVITQICTMSLARVTAAADAALCTPCRAAASSLSAAMS